MKKTLALLLVLFLLAGVLPSAFAAGNSLGNFTQQRSYENRFADVKSTDWFYESVKQGYESGMINGTSATTYAPDRDVSMAEILTLASNLNSIYATGQVSFVQGNPWYQVYVDYAKANGFLPSNVDSYTRPALRGEVAAVLAKALPPCALSPINVIEDDAVPDVQMDQPNATAIYTLYRAGILTGSDAKGTFHPDNKIKRSEIAAIVSRMAYPVSRAPKTYANPDVKELTPEQIAEKCSSAVFSIELFFKNGESFGQASGFFLTSDGLAVTNYHVIQGAFGATVTTTDGKKYPVEGVYSADVEQDLAIIKVKGTGFATLELGDPDKLKQGETIYTISNPLGLTSTFTAGMVSNPKRDFDGALLIQISATIAPGSSGGALLNRKGQVVGVTSSGYFGADLNFAVPVNLLADLGRAGLAPFGIDLRAGYYPGCARSPSFESVTSAKRTDLTVRADGSLTAQYDKKSFASDAAFEAALKLYRDTLVRNGMTQSEITGGWRFTGKSDSLDLTVSGDVIQVTTKVKPKYYDDKNIYLDLGWYLGRMMSFSTYNEDIEEYTYVFEVTDRFTFAEAEQWMEDYFFAALKAAGFARDTKEKVDAGYVYLYVDKSDNWVYIEILKSEDFLFITIT